MADRRMFARSVTESDSFLELSHKAQCLYFHLSMAADDDGFVNNPLSVTRTTGVGKQELVELIDSGYLIAFPNSRVLLIAHFKISNYIQKDRYKPSACAERDLVELTEQKLYVPSKKCEQLMIVSASEIPQSIPHEEKKAIPEADETNIITKAAIESANEIYKAYPKKSGKTKGIEYCLAYLKKGREINGQRVKFTHNELYCAVRNYAFECEENHTKNQFMKMFSTFMNKPVCDYVEEAKVNGTYEEFMKRTYGNEWKSLKFSYT